MQQRPWLDIENGAGDTHKMDHEMRIGVLGFDECWVSHVTCEKFRQVAVRSSHPDALLLCEGCLLTLSTTNTGCIGDIEPLQGSSDYMDVGSSAQQRAASIVGIFATRICSIKSSGTAIAKYGFARRR
jgi:hypothetical protein